MNSAALKAEIVELRTALDSANKKLASFSQAPNTPSAGEAEATKWTTIVKRNAKSQRRRDRNPNSQPQSSSSSSKQPNLSAPSGHCARSGPRAEQIQKAKQRVSGARRIWGTHWSCTAKAVNSAIAKLCGITPNSVKRKFIKNTAGKTTRWWFVIHDTEEVLTSLENKWDQLKLQTLWELEPCFMSESSANRSTNETITAQQPENTSDIESSQSSHQVLNSTSATTVSAGGQEASLPPMVDGDSTPNVSPTDLSSTPPPGSPSASEN